jgi:phenylacetate-CoA ligase
VGTLLPLASRSTLAKASAHCWDADRKGVSPSSGGGRRSAAVLGPWIVRHVIYPHIFGGIKGVSGKSILGHVARFEEQLRWPAERHAEAAFPRVQALVRDAHSHVRIWREKLASVGAEPGDIRTWEDFARIPCLTRDELQSRPDDCLADNIPPEQRILGRSSGSTGVQLEFWTDRAREPLHFATVHLNHRWMGFEVGEREAFLWGDVGFPVGRRSWRRRLEARVLNRMMFYTQQLDEDLLGLLHRRLRRFRPHLLTVFPTLLTVYMRHCRERGLPPPRPRLIVCSGETLIEDLRPQFEETFGAEVYNRYGTTELGDIAHECPAHEGLHINAHRVWVEVMPLENIEDDLGSIVVTDLDNRAMPFIRYETGDLGRLWPEETTHRCACGRTLPRLAGVMGRFTEMVKAPSGRHYQQLCFSKYPKLAAPGILDIQIIHRPPRTVIARCDVDGRFPEDGPARVVRAIHENTNHEFDITVELTDNLLRTPAGKLRRLIIER